MNGPFACFPFVCYHLLHGKTIPRGKMPHSPARKMRAATQPHSSDLIRLTPFVWNAFPKMKPFLPATYI